MRGKSVLAALAGLILVAGILFFGFGSPDVVEIEIEGGGRIGTSRIQALSGFEIGQPWNASFIERAEKELLSLPQVRDVSVSGSVAFPYGIRVQINVSEREPLAVISLGDDVMYWTDSEGHLFLVADNNLNLPVLSHINTEPTETDEGEFPDISDGLMNVISEIVEMPGRLLMRFTEIRLSAHDIQLHSRDGWTAMLAPENVREGLRQLEAVLEAIEREQISDWQFIDLRFSGEVTLR